MGIWNSLKSRLYTACSEGREIRNRTKYDDHPMESTGHRERSYVSEGAILKLSNSRKGSMPGATHCMSTKKRLQTNVMFNT